MADLIKQVQEEVPVPGDLEDAGIENVIDLSPIGIATYEHNPEHDVYIVTLTLDKGGETREYVLSPEGLIDLIELGHRYFYQEMESSTFGLEKALSYKDEIETLLDQIDSGEISLDAAQEEAWTIYGYSEGGLKSGPKSSSHRSTTWGELFGGDTTGLIEVEYEPIFESLGDTLDDDPIWLITRVYVTDDSSYKHEYEAKRPEEHPKESIDMLENGSLMEWFNTYWHGQKFSAE